MSNKNRMGQYADAKGSLMEGPDGNIVFAEGSAVPTDATLGYAPGCIFSKRAGGAFGGLYINEGTAASCDFNFVGSTGGLSLAGLVATAAGLNIAADPASSAAVLVTTKAVLVAEHGKTFFLDLAGGFVVTLPAVAVGLKYSFVVKTAPTTSYTIVCPGAAALFKGHVLTDDVNSATDSDFDTTAVATITLVLNKAVAGDRVDVVCDGVNWHYHAECSVFDAITGT